MRIAYITETYPPEINGVSLTVERTVQFLRQRGHDVDLIRPRQADEAPLKNRQEWRTWGMPLPMYPDLRFGVARVSDLVARFQASQPAVVHLATPGPLAWAAMRAAHKLGIPTTTDFRTNFHVYSRYYHLSWLSPLILQWLRRFHNGSSRTFVPTQQMHDELVAQGFTHLDVVGRGVDTERFHPRHRSQALRDALLPPDAPMLLYVGRLAKEKNVDLALQAFDAIKAGSPQAVMVVVGDGPQREILERQYSGALFVGVQTGEALAQYYATADLFVFPSETETYGNVIPEAMASGLPVLSYDLGAAAELVKNKGAGRVIPAGEPERFVTAACAMAWQYRHSARLKERARAVALSMRWDHVLAQFEHSLMEVAYASKIPATRQARSA
ncbi:MAG: glycosyltransferase family 4 protein [Acidobacteriota bacterium]